MNRRLSKDAARSRSARFRPGSRAPKPIWRPKPRPTNWRPCALRWASQPPWTANRYNVEGSRSQIRTLQSGLEEDQGLLLERGLDLDVLADGAGVEEGQWRSRERSTARGWLIFGVCWMPSGRCYPCRINWPKARAPSPRTWCGSTRRLAEAGHLSPPESLTDMNARILLGPKRRAREARQGENPSRRRPQGRTSPFGGPCKPACIRVVGLQASRKAPCV
jgi:hypothetical protein